MRYYALNAKQINSLTADEQHSRMNCIIMPPNHEEQVNTPMVPAIPETD